MRRKQKPKTEVTLYIDNKTRDKVIRDLHATHIHQSRQKC